MNYKNRNCCNCNRDYNQCKYINIERIMRLESKEECPYWIPVNIDNLKRKVEEKLKKHGFRF